MTIEKESVNEQRKKRGQGEKKREDHELDISSQSEEPSAFPRVEKDEKRKTKEWLSRFRVKEICRKLGCVPVVMTSPPEHAFHE